MRKTNKILSVILAVLLLISAMSVTAFAADSTTLTAEIPGFGELHFKAGQTEQNMTVPNPPQNFCWFKVSLMLEDGTVLWTSDLIAPGEESEKVVLNEPLEKGEYKNAMLKYQCFADEAEQNALNGAETKLTIIVK